MNGYVLQVAQSFLAGSPQTQGVMSFAKIGIMLATKLIVGEPDKLTGTSPTYQKLGQNIAQIGSQALDAAKNVQSWKGEASESFLKKVDDVVRQVQELAPMMQQMGELLNNAAQAAKEAAQSLQQIVQEVTVLIEMAYQVAQAAASATFGASLVKWFAWAIGQAARLLAQVIKIVKQIADFLNKIAAVVKNLREFFQKAAQIVNALCKILGIDPPQITVAGQQTPGKESDFEKKANWGDDKSLEWKPKDWSQKDFGEKEEQKGPKLGWKFDIAKFSWEPLGHKEEFEFEPREVGPGTLSGKAAFEANLLKMEGKVYASEKGIGADISAQIGVKGSAEGQFSSGIGTTKAEGSLFGGASADAKANISHTGASAEAGAFAGVKAEGSLSHEMGPASLGVKGEAWAGAGAEADFQARWDKGKITFGGSAGAGLGVGGKVGFEVTFDVNKAVGMVGNAAGSARDFFAQ